MDYRELVKATNKEMIADFMKSKRPELWINSNGLRRPVVEVVLGFRWAPPVDLICVH